MSDLDSLKAAIRPNTKLVYAETPCNPILRLTDIVAAAKIAHDAGALFAVDSTWATPTATHPIELGADFVVHSLTKYICGHGDALGGVILGRAVDLEPIRKKLAIQLGSTISPFNAWLIMRGIATFPLRMRVHQENALKVAQWLEGNPKVKRVIYPGLASHPQVELAKRQMKNFSAMLTFQVDKPEETAYRFLSGSLKMIHFAVSLGHQRSLIFYMPTSMMLANTIRLDTQKQRESWDYYAGEGIFRFSVGLENAEDIIADLDGAL